MDVPCFPAGPRGDRQGTCQGTSKDDATMCQERNCSDDDLFAQGDLLGWELLDPSPEEAKLLGAEGDYLAHGIDHEDVEKVLTRISREGTLHARQAIEAATGAFS